MFADYFFEPHHIVPATEFAATLVERSRKRVAEVLVELHTVEIEILVSFVRRDTDAGVKVGYAIFLSAVSSC